MLGAEELKERIEVTDKTVECPVRGCNEKVERQRKDTRDKKIRFKCPIHRIIISPSTFEYPSDFDNLLWKEGPDKELLERIRGSKRESRMAHDNSVPQVPNFPLSHYYALTAEELITVNIPLDVKLTTVGESMLDSGTLYRPQSKILMLIICSLHKEAGGIQQYYEKESLISKLEEKTKDLLIKSRKDAYKFLTEGQLEWQAIPVKDHILNKELQFGKDLGGHQDGRYLPALRRYTGRFYRELGEEGKEKLLRSKHHVLIESGLYGLELPTEPIQLYTLDIRDGSEVQRIWKEKNRVLTRVLLEYIQTNGIERIFDLTAREDYRELFDWGIVRKRVQVLHCFSRKGSGDDALNDFAELMKSYLLEASEEELLTLKPEDEKDDVRIRDRPYPPTGFPKEEQHSTTKGPQTGGQGGIQPPGGTPPPKSVDWGIIFDSDFHKSLKQICDKTMESRILVGILRISEDPMKQIEGTQERLADNLKDLWSRHVGTNYRIVYQPIPEENIVYLLRVGTHPSVYDHVHPRSWPNLQQCSIYCGFTSCPCRRA